MKESWFLVLLLYGTLLFSCTRAGNKSNISASSAFEGTWLRSYEEDTEDFMVYRPVTFGFPPSRGRPGFSLNEDGTAEMIQIAPTDGMERKPAKWRYEEDASKLVFEVEKGGKNLVYKVLSKDMDMMRLKIQFD